MKTGKAEPMTDEFTPPTTIADHLPNWIVYLGCLLATIGIVTGLLGVISPTKFFSDFPNFTQWSDISYVTTGWGIRNLAMGAVMLLTLWLRTPSAIAVVFSMRFLTELADLEHWAWLDGRSVRHRRGRVDWHFFGSRGAGGTLGNC
ncbi:hypothetical protein IQ266_05925 [filamentous cyanobacterium LEGE 11480]|uniref:Uncharacterized protein n=1 Tax=Romeriopsis navalis LEGE 11480 TaxID=2777977 RepID=A0A928Z290_9CYAN|nr:hypothetical protein [Romeriopsis navalis]MBE9029299.1 hypothetical protein [Romeriopsis navalis LEGE 11480]